MSKQKIHSAAPNLTLFALFALFGISTSAYARTPQAQNVAADSSYSATADYRIGANDVLAVSVVDAPEFSGKYRVSEAGMIEIVGGARPIHAEGYTPGELSRVIRQSLIDSKQLREPKVSVFVEEFHGNSITVLGSVSRPGTFALQKHTNVLEALSLAGGAQANAGSTVTIMRGAASAEATGTDVGSVKIVELYRVLRGEDPAANVEVRKGDVINLSAAQLVYVVGAVTKPGGFVMSSPTEGVSVVQAIALAEGFKQTASVHRGLIIRQSTSSSARQEIPVDMAEMMSGKTADALLAPNDILYVPTSGTKKTLKVMGDVAMAAVNGVAIYGLGYRIGTHP